MSHFRDPDPFEGAGLPDVLTDGLLDFNAKGAEMTIGLQQRFHRVIILDLFAQLNAQLNAPRCKMVSISRSARDSAPS
jgi:hypothetical protein